MISKKDLEDRLAIKKASLAIAYTAHDELLATTVEELRFDSGEGSQRSKQRKLGEHQEIIKALEADIDSICRRLQGKGLTSIVLRRRHGCRR